jgi:hypothetical protein
MFIFLKTGENVIINLYIKMIECVFLGNNEKLYFKISDKLTVFIINIS